ncbi:hypothetical protein D3C78_1723470 [compost metagenome]
MGTNDTEQSHTITQRKAEVGGGLYRFTVEIEVLVLELAQINVGTFEGQVAVYTITCKHLVAVVFIAQMGFVGFNAGDAGA